MARLARVVVSGLPHHITQRGNGRQQTFFADADYALYRDLLAESLNAAGVACWAWVLMPNHVHLILVPSDEDGLRRALAPVHRRYAGIIHARRKRTGHFWQGRFGCAVMDEDHLAAALVYVMHNPVRARLVERAQDWRWSSARAYQRGVSDPLTQTRPVLERFPDMGEMLKYKADADAIRRIRAAETIGRPVGGPGFLRRIERKTGRDLVPGKRGPKPKRRPAS
jgi:putative transposase